MRKLYLGTSFLSLFLLSGFGVNAQDTAQIEGKVSDSDSGLPIPFATVFLNNTSIGTVADSMGNFSLKHVPVQYTDLVVSSIGYESFLTRISLSPAQVLNVTAKLHLSKKLLNEIVVKGSRDREWKKYYERFVKEFLGDGPNTALCEIKNAGILNFSFSGDGIFKVVASSPLEIYNRALGYKVLVILKHYESTAKGYSASYQSHFFELEPTSLQEDYRWKVNRIRSYKGSLRHFLRSLIDKRTQSEGYEVYYRAVSKLYNGREVLLRTNDQVPPNVLLPEIASESKLKGYYKLLKRATFEIHYLKKFVPRSKRVFLDFPHPISWLEVPDEFLLCPLNGVINSNSNFVVSGDMGQYRIADILPQDYDPVPDEGRAYLISHAQLRTIRGTISDSASSLPLSGAHVFLNNSLFNTVTDNKGRFEIEKVPQGVYDLVAAYSDYPVQSKKIEVNDDTVTMILFKVNSENKNTWEKDQKEKSEALRYFKVHFMRRAFFSTIKILNPDVIEIKRFAKKVRMRTRTTLEMEDDQTGYKLHYYLKEAILDRRRETKDVITGYTSFDTVPANNSRQLRKWQGNRDGYYYGSVDHFMKALAGGRTQDEGFEIYGSVLNNNGDGKMRSGSGLAVKSRLLLGDSLLGKSKGGMLRLRFPENAVIRYRVGKPTRITADTSIQISELGILSTEKGLSMIGPMERKALPVLPLGYVPLSETISDPRVWIYVKANELNVLNQIREKPYLHTDKDYYYPGEKIWYKAYMRYASSALKDSLSKILYVELIGPDKKIVKREILKIENGVSWGDLTLPDTLKPGNYYLRAFTKWALNFGEENIFSRPLPVLSTDQNVDPQETAGRMVSAGKPTVIFQSDRPFYKPREKITIKFKVSDPEAEPFNSNVSVSVTDANRISHLDIIKPIIGDSLRSKENLKWRRISYPLEKAFGYDCIVKKNSNETPTNVAISSLRDNRIVNGTPDHEGKFRFYAEFYDTMSFIFRASLRDGGFAGHVMIEKPYSPPVIIAPYAVKVLGMQDDAKQRIKYTYDPFEKRTMLEEVIINGTRIDPPAEFAKTVSLLQNPSVSISGETLFNITQSIQDIDAFMQAIADKVGGARYDRTTHRFFLRTSGMVSLPGLNKSAAIYLENILNPEMLTIIPAEIGKVEVYKNVSELSILGTNASNGVVKLFLKKLSESPKINAAGNKPNQYDRFTLSGFASPAPFYMRDYEINSADNAFPDLRTTIYWNPNVSTEGEEATVTFYAADTPARYRIIVEGLSDKGQPIFGQQIIEVK